MYAVPASDAPRGLSSAFFGATMAACFLIAWKQSVQYASPSLAVLVMLSSAAICNSLTALFVVLRTPRESLAPALSPGESGRVSGRQLTVLAAALAIFTLLGNWSSAEAVSRISGALLAVVQRCEVIVVALLGALLLGERVRAPFWVGTVIAGIGLWVLQQPAASGVEFDPTGALFGLGSAVCFGSIIVLSRRYVRRVQPFVLNALRLWISTGFWFAVERRVPAAAELSPGLLLYAGLAGFFGPFLSRLGALLSARHIPASVTALSSLATPVVTVLLGFVLFGELPAWREVVGGSIMLLGVAIPIAALFRAQP